MPVRVREVSSPEDLESFLALRPRLDREAGRIPPEPGLYARFLSREANPYFAHADAGFLLAERDGEVVGHVIAHIDQVLNEFQGNRWGLFGFFDAEDDQEVADALFEAAASWLGERGRDRMVGPLQFSTKDDLGLLVEGNDLRPVILQPWHPPYYRTLVEGAGLGKVIDVVWRDLELDQIPQPLLDGAERWAGLASSRYGVTIRPLSEEEPEGDLERVFRFMRPIFETDWGYAPWTDRELAESLGMAMQLVGPGTLIAELRGELIAASMLVPDFNQMFKIENGQAVRSEDGIDQGRAMFMAVAPAYRHLGVMPALGHANLECARRQGFSRLVIGWSFEDNEQMNRGMERLGLEVSRRHRIYSKELSPASPAREPATSE